MHDGKFLHLPVVDRGNTLMGENVAHKSW
jgi:hypothetical protein